MLNLSELQERIERFEGWHYQFELQGILTPITDSRNVNRHRQRKQYFFEPLLQICGGSLRGRRVLDLGCNAGYWSLAALEAGCDFVCAIDARQVHVEQAQLVFEAHGIDPQRYQLIQGDLFETDLEQFGEFDVVLCLGLLYHINRPMELLRRIAALNRHFLVIDTNIYPSPLPTILLCHENTVDPRHAVESTLICLPSAAAVIEMVRSLGYHGVMLRPDFSDYTGAEDFQGGRRRAFLCAKSGLVYFFCDRAEALF
jgi:SAM-dependent methyltransferase